MDAVKIDRDAFIDRYFDYRAGEHVSFIGPTGTGKTLFGFQLLDRACSPELPGIVLCMKPQDETVSKWTKALRFRRVATWPPLYSVFKPSKPRGWTLWPKHSFDPVIDDERHAKEFRRAILDSYKKGKRILFADEVYSLDKELGLDRELITVWSKGRSMKCGLWGATQKPTHVPTWMYNQANHLFLAYDPDKRSRDRFAEIGGMDPKMISELVMGLGEYEWLYIRKRDRTMCVVAAQ